MKRWAVTLAGALAGTALVVAGPSHAEDESVAITFSDLPALPAGETTAIRLDGVHAYVSLNSAAGRPSLVYRTPSDGTGTWELVMDPATGEPLLSSSPALGVDHGRILARLETADDVCAYRLITSPEEARTLTGCVSRQLVLGGGSILSVDTTVSPAPWTLESVTGEVLEQGTGRRPGFAEGIAAEVVDAHHVGIRRVGETDYQTVQAVPEACVLGGTVSVRPPYVIAACTGTSVSALLTLDASTVPYPLGQAGGGALGSGFRILNVATNSTPYPLTLQDLGAARTVFPRSGVEVTRVAADPGKDPALIVETAAGTLRVGRITGLSDPGSTVDSVAPTIASVTPPGTITGDTTPSFWWSPGPTGEVWTRYEVRTRVARHGATPPAWSPVADPLGNEAKVAVPSGIADADVCLQVRARDWAGNIGAWKQACTRVDRIPPRVWWPAGPTDLLLEAPASTPVRVTWSGADNAAVGSYDVSYRVALAGRPAGAWVSPSELKGYSSPPVKKVFPAGSTVCFRVTARDRAQLTARTTTAHCRSIPMDDRTFALQANARRGRSTSAFESTVTLLRAGDSMVRSGMRAHRVSIRVDGLPRGGCPQVYLAGVRTTSCSVTRDSMATYYRYTFPRTLQGSLRVRLGAVPAGTVYRVDSVYASHS